MRNRDSGGQKLEKNRLGGEAAVGTEAKNSREVKTDKKITAGMSDSERTEVLRTKNVIAYPYTGQADAIIAEESENLQSKERKIVLKALKRVGEEFEINKNYHVSDVKMTVSVSNGTIQESRAKLITEPSELAKIMPVLNYAVENAIGIETHDNRYFHDNNTVFVHELLGGYTDGDFFVPVRFGVKEFRDGSYKVHVVVSQEKIKTGVIGIHDMDKSSGQHTPYPVKASIAQIAKEVNTGDLLRYLPDVALQLM